MSQRREVSVQSERVQRLLDYADHVQAARVALELRDSLEEMLNAALEERLPSEEVRGRAFEVFLKAKGLA